MAIFTDSTTHGDMLVADTQALGHITENFTVVAFLGGKKLPLESIFYFDSFRPKR